LNNAQPLQLDFNKPILMYCRQSSLEQQEEKCREYAKQLGLKGVEVFKEEKTEQSPSFLQGYQEAVQWLESWQENGFDSMGNAASYMRQEAMEELEGLESLSHWEYQQVNQEDWQGWLSALDGYQHWTNPFSK
jgi:ribosomal protein L11 methylase PrmA